MWRDTRLVGRSHTMKPWILATTWIFALTNLHSAEFWLGWEWCAQKGHAAATTSPSSAAQRKYAPDRRIDVKHLKLDFTPNFAKRSLTGTATLTFAPIAKPVREIKLDAIDLRIEDVEANIPLESYHVEEEHLSFLFQNPVPAGQEVRLTVHYFAEPQDGLFFRTPEMGYKPGDTHLWTQGEPQRHRYWYPSYDYPNERFSTEIICHVPKGMTVLSNGELIEESVAGDLATFHWLQKEPHVNYLVSVVAGYLKKLEDDFRGIPLGFFTPPSDFPQAANSFTDTKEILAFYEREIGVPYPWAKYYNVCVQGYPYGGMENTSVTTLTTRTLFTKETETLYTTRHLDAHEVAHQWFGDLVTCKDWTHLWLNEGFATYYTELYEEHKFGRDHKLYRMHQNARRVIESKDDKPIAWRKYSRPWEQFDYRAYPKGAWVLHMLRSQLGADLYRQAVKTYLQRHRFDVAVTEDLNAAVEDVSGRSFDRFFDEWVYHGGTPKLGVSYAWDGKRKQARLSVAQTQKLSDRVLLFHVPLPVRFYLGEERHDFEIAVSQAREDFYFDLPAAPTAVRIDPDYTVLADVSVKLPNPLVEAQAELPDDMLGRLFAVQMLGKRKDSKSLDLLTKRLASDPFFGVRIEAAKALGNRQSDDALQALLGAGEQEDARVRLEIVKSIGRYYHPDARTRLATFVQHEANPGIATAAIEGLAKFPGEDVEAALLAALDRESFRHRIAAAAIEALRVQDRPTAAQPVLAHLRAKSSAFVDRDFGKALKSLGFLGRNLEFGPREEIRRFIAGFTSDPREQLHVPAIEALAKLEDPRSVAILENLAVENGSRPKVAEAAKKAVAALNAEKGQPQELKDLRGEVLDLREELRRIRDSLQKLEKQTTPEN